MQQVNIYLKHHEATMASWCYSLTIINTTLIFTIFVMYTQQHLMRTTTKDIRSKSVFELSAEELSERLKPTADAVKRETFARNGYLTYFDQAICPDTSYMVHEYRDKKELVQIDDKGKAHFIKIL